MKLLTETFGLMRQPELSVQGRSEAKQPSEGSAVFLRLFTQWDRRKVGRRPYGCRAACLHKDLTALEWCFCICVL